MKTKNLITLTLCTFMLLRVDAAQAKEKALHHFMQGEFLMNQGNYALAVLEFQDAIELDPNAPTIHVSIADAYRRLGKGKRSEDHLKIALELDPQEIEAREMLGQLYIAQKKILDAQTIFKELHELYPDNIDYIFMLADLAQLQKNWDDAIDFYIQSYQINSMAVNALEQALQIALTTNSFDRAEEVCELLLEDDPDNLKFLETMRDLTLFSQKYEITLEFVKRIEKVNGTTLELLIQKSALYEELGKLDMALNIMYEALELDSINADILHRLVALLMDNNDHQNAILYNQKFVDRYPDDPRGFINNALMALTGKNPGDAILALSPHVDRFPQDFTIQYLIGTAYYQLKDYQNAEIYLSKALNLFPESRNTKHNLALIYDSIGKWELSDRLYMELIATDSTDAQAFNNYAYSLVEREEDIEFALELAKNAIRLSPNSAPYLDTIGWIYFKMDHFDEAIKYIRESLNLDQENSTIQEHMNEVLRAMSAKTIPKVQQVEKQD
tara:strand:+ start:1449 stop:2948 length:1500 start_codon:yes stop_codon:yes gene_type:complete